MLGNVPAAINRMARSVVINHPYSFNVQVFRKTVTRTEVETMGGLPTLGGLGVLDSNDEAEFNYSWIGNGFALPAEPFQPSPMMDRQDAHNHGSGMEFRFLIEPEEAEGFRLKSHDVFYLLLGDDPAPAKLAFEVALVEAVINLPPFCRRYVAHRRDDLHVAAG